MRIIFEHDIAKAQEMLKYMRHIRYAASRLYHWYKYDEKFCLLLVSNTTMSFGEIHSEFFLLYVTNRSNNQYTSKKSAGPILVQNSKYKSSVSPSNKTQPNVKQHFSCNMYNQGKFFLAC